MTDTPTMMNIEQAAAFLQMPVSKVRTLCQTRAQERMGEKRLPFIRVGRAVYFTRSTLIGWIRKQQGR